LDEKTKQRLLEDIGYLENFTGLKSHLDIEDARAERLL
jgi:hypothetical protein